MSEPATTDDPLASPCIGICRMDTAREFCTGCFRTLEEIGCWQMFSDADKRRILEQLPDRRAASTGECGEPG